MIYLGEVHEIEILRKFIYRNKIPLGGTGCETCGRSPYELSEGAGRVV